VSFATGTFPSAHEVRHQALRLADRQPRHPRTVPPEEERAGAISARHERVLRAREGPGMAHNDLVQYLHDSLTNDPARPRGCSTTAPGHATNLTGVKLALALGDDPYRAPVDARVDGVTGDHVILALPGGPLVARCHDAARLQRLLDAGVCPDGPFGRFSAHEHQLLVVVDAELAAGLGTTYLVSAATARTGAVAAFNLALPWHAYVPCRRGSDG